MASFEENTHVFIIRIWLERREIEDAGPQWRGVIEHVFSKQRRYVQDPDDITAFILPYLEDMGVKFGLYWRVSQWLKQWMLPGKQQN